MYFNFFRLIYNLSVKFSVFTLTFLVTISCSKFYEKKKQDKPYQYKMSELECVDQIRPNFEKYFKAELTEVELDQTFNCLDKALTEFSSKTKGSLENAYTAQDLYDFFKEYTKINKFSADFFKELLILKEALFKGNKESLTKTELSKLIKILDVVRAELKHNLQYIPLYNEDLRLHLSKFDYPIAKIEQATKILNQSLKRLLSETELTQSKYTFEDFKNLIEAGENEFQVIETDEWELVNQFKQVFFGSEPQLTSVQQWHNSIDLISQALNSFLTYDLQLKKSDYLLTTDQFLSLDFTVTQMIYALENSLKLRQGQIILTQDIDAFIKYFVTKQKVELKFKLETLLLTYQVALKKLFSGQPNQDVLGLDLSHLNKIKLEYLNWFLAQNFLVSSHLNISDVSFKSQIETYDIKSIMQSKWPVSMLDQKDVVNSWNEFKNVSLNPLSMRWTDNNKTHIQTDLKKRSLKYNDYALTNAFRILNRIFLKSYSQTKNVSPYQMLFEQKNLESIFADFRPICEELGLMDPRKSNSAERTFKEGNFFTYAGNGDNYLNYLEATELLSLLYSGGDTILKELRNLMKNKSCEMNEIDVFGFNKLQESCFKLHVKSSFTKLFENMPTMAQYVHGMNQNDWDQFYNELMRISRVDSQAVGKVESGDLRFFIMILEYAEALFVVFDQDKNNLFSQEEIENAYYKRFRPFILEIIEKEYGSLFANDMIGEKAFKYIVYEGTIPSYELITDIGFGWDDFFGNLGNVGRFKIMRALGELKSKIPDQ